MDKGIHPHPARSNVGVRKIGPAYFHFVISYLERADKSAARSEAWNVFARSNTGIVGSNPTTGRDVCLKFFLCLCCPVYVTALR
jgi:hypothetical protein